MRRLLLSVTFCLSGCIAAPTPDQPQPEAVLVAVRVLTYETEQPIAGAIVLRDAVPIGSTGADGLFIFEVARGTTVLLEASKDGYGRSLAAESEVNGSHERWTFYLEPFGRGIE